VAAVPPVLQPLPLLVVAVSSMAAVRRRQHAWGALPLPHLYLLYGLHPPHVWQNGCLHQVCAWQFCTLTVL
jgi:hypothetical protein